MPLHPTTSRKRFRPRLAELALVSLGILGWSVAPATTVTVTQKGPLESVSPSGDVTGVTEASAGVQYTFVSFNADEVTMKDASGGLFRMAVNATDYVPPPVAVPTAPPAAASSSVTTNAVSIPAKLPSSETAASAGSVNPSPSGSPSSDTSAGTDAAGSSTVPQDKVDSINGGLGKPVFSSSSFWTEPALVIAQRLGLALEGRTKWETSYRRYFSGNAADKDAAMLGTGAYCIALYADADDHPTSLLIAFANDGDYKNVSRLTSDIFAIDHAVHGAHRWFPDKSRDDLQKEYDDDVASFEPARKAESETLTNSLTGLFGDPKYATFGDGPATREDIKRWDWNDVSFLLTCQENKYNLLRVVPTALADNNGRQERIARDEIGDKLSGAVEHRPNGDVVITQIPMADQGSKGFCVPATWERVLRYEGVPGDMYTLSRIGSTGFGGGTYGGNIAGMLDDTLHNYGRHCEFLDIDMLDALSIHRYIDQGIPIFWSVNPYGYTPALQRYALADRDKEWDRWKTLLQQAETDEAKGLPTLENDGGHQVLIIGYNSDTKEIAWTDPWGRNTSERWMTTAEAQHCSLNQYYTISW